MAYEPGVKVSQDPISDNLQHVTEEVMRLRTENAELKKKLESRETQIAQQHNEVFIEVRPGSR